MVKIVHHDENGNQVAEIELDDFTIEILYSGIAELLRIAAQEQSRAAHAAPVELSSKERQRREKILARLRG
jgi:hypothetical protein